MTATGRARVWCWQNGHTARPDDHNGYDVGAGCAAACSEVWRTM